MDTLTQLRSFGPVLAKRWSRGPDGKPEELRRDPAKHFAVIEHPVGSVFDLVTALDSLSGDRLSCVIRGQLKLWQNPLRVRRTNEAFFDVPRWYSLHDFDSVECPPWIDWRKEPNAAAAFLRSLLPPEFHEATCYWSFTGGQGFKRELRMRLAFWHDRRVAGAELKAWLGEKEPVVAVPSAPPSRPQHLPPRPADLHGSSNP